MIYNVDYVRKNDYSLGPWNEMGAPSKGKGDGELAGLLVKNGNAVRRGVP